MKNFDLNLTGFISSIYTGSCVDGPGIRCVVFLSGCNLNCPFCHNPETLYLKGIKYSVEELSKKLLRYLPYLKNGGITLSGGEPFLQADFCINLINVLKKSSVNIIIETNGTIINKALINACDLLIVDIKNFDETTDIFKFLDCCQKFNKPVKVTNVVIPSVNDNIEKLKIIRNIVKTYPNILGVEFLPFKKLCVDKYKELNKPFIYENYQEGTYDTIKKVTDIYNKLQ